MKNIFSILFVLAISISVNAQTVLFLDAGHGGKDKGAMTSNGVSEAEINNFVVKEIKELAEAKGIKVFLLSEATKYIPLKDRVKNANEYQLGKDETGILISIHANFSEDFTKSGAEVMIMKAEERSEGSMDLAQKMAAALESPIIEKGLSILREAKMPAILIETGYLSNEQDSMNLQTPDMRTLLVRKIVSAL